MTEKRSKMPWIKEPTVWRTFWEERCVGDCLSKKKLYRESAEIREQYSWFSKGFYYGGCS